MVAMPGTAGSVIGSNVLAGWPSTCAHANYPYSLIPETAEEAQLPGIIRTKLGI